ncbi:hypothetical protein RCIX2637 [Methanocella arvoryzae MRE50]|uniref:Uncharacterized protein n=2 Tax=Methanocella TaxID=570266 RepID=Q0W1R1_METAR|nr:hypothetical protein RCIX2637 [Methanocella arvoryzae MRE50]
MRVRMKVLFMVKQKDRNDIPCAYEFEQQVFNIKKGMKAALGTGNYDIQTSFDQASVLYPKRFMFDYISEDHTIHKPRAVIDAFFDTIEKTGICLSKFDVHITIEWM